MNVTQLNRSRRIGQLKSIIIGNSKNGKVTSYEKMVAYMMQNYWVARRTAVEYVNATIDGERIKKDGDELYAPKDEIADIEKEADDILKPHIEDIS